MHDKPRFRMAARLGYVAIILVLAAGVALAPADEAQQENSPAAPDTSGWDWGSFGEIDETPLTERQSNMDARIADLGARRPAVAEPDMEAPTQVAYALFADMPQLQVIPSVKDTDMHPCSSCHEWVESNPEPRELEAPHDNFTLDHGMHGRGQFWCFTCHDLSGEGGLRTLEGERLEFDEAYLLCSQCHTEEARDWAFGAHGKRVGSWQGTREVFNCTACHYPHDPAIEPREPLPPPTLRAGLSRPEPPAHDHGEPLRLWEKLARSIGEYFNEDVAQQ